MDLKRMISKKKLKPFDIIVVRIELQGKISFWDWLRLLYYWFKAVKLRKFNLTLFGHKWCEVWRLIIPYYVKGNVNEER